MNRHTGQGLSIDGGIKGINRLQSVLLKFSTGKDHDCTFFGLEDDDKITKKNPDESLESKHVDFELAADVSSKVDVNNYPRPGRPHHPDIVQHDHSGKTGITSVSVRRQRSHTCAFPTTTEVLKYIVLDVVSSAFLVFVLRGNISPTSIREIEGYLFIFFEQYVDKREFRLRGH
ncbi:MAG: hypothetical protein Q9219_002798 [cf. Caloplaca sp. 3 TL-2023]